MTELLKESARWNQRVAERCENIWRYLSATMVAVRHEESSRSHEPTMESVMKEGI